MSGQRLAACHCQAMAQIISTDRIDFTSLSACFCSVFYFILFIYFQSKELNDDHRYSVPLPGKLFSPGVWLLRHSRLWPLRTYPVINRGWHWMILFGFLVFAKQTPWPLRVPPIKRFFSVALLEREVSLNNACLPWQCAVSYWIVEVQYLNRASSTH